MDKGISPEQQAAEPPNARILDLRQMAREPAELGDEEAPRLQSEARGLLIALRELAVRFPDAVLRDKSP